jgi:feruloyl esterase
MSPDQSGIGGMIVIWAGIVAIIRIAATSEKAAASAASVSLAPVVSCSVASVQAIAPTGVTIMTATTTALNSSNYCAVAGSFVTTNPGPNTVEFQVDLPATWNGRSEFFGNLGFAGSLTPAVPQELTNSLNKGYATTFTDTGHESSGGGFALNPAQLADYEYRSVHLVAQNVKALATSYYASAPAFSYFDGCSFGGKQGIYEAEDYPSDFNGVVTGDAPIGNVYAAMAWNEQAILQTADSYVTPDAISVLSAANMNQCDGLDGVVDGLIQDPRRCNLDPAKLQCASGQNPPGCLTAGQVTAVKAIYAGPTDGSGTQLYSPSVQGDMNGIGGWAKWITGCTGTGTCLPPQLGVRQPWGNIPPAPTAWATQDGFMRYFAFSNANYSSLSFNFSDPTSVATEAAAAQNQGWDGFTDLSKLQNFVSGGGKLLLYHGWEDQGVSALTTLDFFQRVSTLVGPSVSANVRLFLAPGMYHCPGNGSGPNIFDRFTALTNWVEKGLAPDGIVASHKSATTGKTDRTMPLCSYPETAHYNGIGNVNTANSWTCY